MGAEYSDRDIRAAWAVHALTATGVIVGFVALNAVIDGDARAAIVWLVVALLLDGIDGPIARKLEVRKRIPHLNGNSLDLIIDYFTCTIIPVAFLCKFDVLPSKTVGPLGFAILFVSALWMSRDDQETEDGWFNGFPAEWNMIIPTLFLLHPNPWITFAVCIIFCASDVVEGAVPSPGLGPRTPSDLVDLHGRLARLDAVAGHRPTRRVGRANRAVHRPDVDDRASDHAPDAATTGAGNIARELIPFDQRLHSEVVAVRPSLRRSACDSAAVADACPGHSRVETMGIEPTTSTLQR